MYVAGHAAAGALIGHQVDGNALLIFILAFISHLVLDLIPHGDRHHVVDYYFGERKKLKQIYNGIVIDTVATIIMVAILMSYTTFNKIGMAWGIIGGVLPDLLVGLNEVMNNSKLKWFTKMHFKVHNALIHKIRVKPLSGTLFQIVLITGILVAL